VTDPAGDADPSGDADGDEQRLARLMAEYRDLERDYAAYPGFGELAAKRQRIAGEIERLRRRVTPR
jgi:hypothetical protein